MAIEGPLSELSLQDVLQLMEMSRKTGVLTVWSERQDDEVELHLGRGELLHARRRRTTHRLGQQLLRAGKLTQRELERALELQRNGSSGLPLGDILVEMGSIDGEELERQLRFQLEETIYDVMGWEEGRFRFEEREDVGSGGAAVRVRVNSLLMEGARRIDEWARLEPKIPSPESVPLLVATEEDTAAPLELHPREWEVLAEIDGERTLRRIASGLGQSTFDVAKIIYGLIGLGVVEVLERPARVPARELDAAIAEVEELLDDGDAEAAGRLAAELQDASPDRAELALLNGRSLAAQDRMRAATEALARAASLDPLSPETHYHLGFAAVRIGELGRAARAWENFLRLSPEGERQSAGRRVVQGLRAVQALNRIVKGTTQP